MKKVKKSSSDANNANEGKPKRAELPKVCKEANELFAKFYELSAKSIEGKSTMEIISEAFPEQNKILTSNFTKNGKEEKIQKR